MTRSDNEKSHTTNYSLLSDSARRAQKKKMKRIKIGGIEFESVSAAAKHHGVTHPLIRHQYNRFGTFRGMEVEYLD